MRRDLLSRFKSSVILEINSNPGRAERMAAYQSGYAVSKAPVAESPL
jgi:hypothetical protein